MSKLQVRTFALLPPKTRTFNIYQHATGGRPPACFNKPPRELGWALKVEKHGTVPNSVMWKVLGRACTKCPLFGQKVV